MRIQQMLKQVCVAGLLAAVLAGASAGVASAQDEIYEGSTITGTVVAFSGRLGSRSSNFRLIIRNYTSRADVERLNEVLRSGQDKLLDAISGMSAGQIQIGNGVGVPANVIFAEPSANGETKITVIYQRNVRFSELRYGTRSADYRFGYAELFIRRNGAGQGTLIPAAKIRLREGNTWEVEDFGIYPARLLGLRVRGGRVPR
ncbi:MAG TPA: hypothetical protein VFH15_12770 [Pyrinomonadaceae bacterium]|nr:hypothetical protein [Pyrinomonadaceae bacterium]